MGTESSLLLPQGGASLPAPKVRRRAPGPQLVSTWHAPLASLVFVNFVAPIEVVALDVPDDLLDPARGLQLELLRYTSRSRRAPRTGAPYQWQKHAAYVHPANSPVSSGNGFATRGGGHSDAPVPLLALRQTEWQITSHGQVVNVTQSLAAHMKLRQVWWRDSSMNVNPLVAPTTWETRTSGAGFSIDVPGRRYPYSRSFRIGYFAFRFSVIDASSGFRVHGPTSETVSVSSERFPFIPDGIGPGGEAAAIVAPGFDPSTWMAWIGKVSRIP